MNESSAIRQVFSHPAVGIIGSIASVISLGLAVYFYRAGLKTRDLSYYLHPVRTNVVSFSDQSPLQVRYAGEEVKGSVTALQFAIWNAGHEPIRTADILETLTLTSSPTVRILESKVREVSRRVIGFRVDETAKAEGRLSFNWEILEQNDGAAIQILFEGSPSAEFSLRGIVVGQDAIREIKAEERRLNLEMEMSKRAENTVLIIATGVSLVVVGATIRTSLRILRRGRDTFTLWLAVANVVAMIVLLVYVVARLFAPSIPFTY